MVLTWEQTGPPELAMHVATSSGTQEIALLAPSGQRSGMLTSPGQPLTTREDRIGTGVCPEAPGRDWECFG